MSDEKKSNLFNRSKEADKQASKVARQKGTVIAETIVLIVSAAMTLVFFVMLAIETFPMAYGIPEALAFFLGLALALIGIIPGEYSAWLNVTRFTDESDITTAQQIVSGIAAFVAIMVAAATSISTIVFFFPSLIPDWYLAMSNNVNLWSLIIGWLALLIAHVAFKITSRSSRTNKARANAKGKLIDAENAAIISFAQGMREASDDIIDQMDTDGIFKADALRLVANVMEMRETRLPYAKRSAIAAGAQGADLDELFRPEREPVVVDADEDQGTSYNGRPSIIPLGRNDNDKNGIGYNVNLVEAARNMQRGNPTQALEGD